MTKTKEQVKVFLTGAKFASEEDYSLVSERCVKVYGMRLHKPGSYSSAGITVTMFGKWEEELYGAGDVVRVGDEFYLVKSCTEKECHTCARMGQDGLVLEDNTISVECSSMADKTASEGLYMALRSIGKEFMRPFPIISDVYVPKAGDIVSFTNIKNGETGSGVVRAVLEDGRTEMFCYHIKGGGVFHSMHGILGFLCDYSFQPSSPDGYPRKSLESALNKVGKTWNHPQRRVEPLDMRAPKGEPYYYVNDRMCVTQATETMTPASQRRYIAGNYFRSYDKAITMARAEQELRKDALAG